MSQFLVYFRSKYFLQITTYKVRNYKLFIKFLSLSGEFLILYRLAAKAERIDNIWPVQ